MVRNITEKEKEQILNLGAFEYSAKMCSSVLGWDEEEIQSYLNNDQSDFYKLYETGRTKAQYVIDLKLFEQAQAGDIKSLDKLQQRKRLRK